MEAQFPQVCLQLSKFVLVSVVKPEARVLSLHHSQFEHSRLVYLFQLTQEASIQLKMDPSAYLVLQSEFSINVLECDVLVTWLSMALVVAVQ